MTPALERHLLQVAIAIGGLVPIGAGLRGAILGAAMTGASIVGVGAPGGDLDSHVRYLSGLLLGIGIAFWAAIPGIERQTGRVRLLTLIVFLGGLARLAGVLLNGLPGPPMIFGLAMELVVTPAIALWQGRVARRCGAPG